MNIGKTLFAQMMDFLPWKSFHRIVARYSGDYRVRVDVLVEIALLLALVHDFRVSHIRQWWLWN